jgi:hypothetical protein
MNWNILWLLAPVYVIVMVTISIFSHWVVKEKRR